ncbi:hypothetical protein [Dyella mobilis]|uniref:DUF4239 domain-containing protein n=1 Tax=Dyella mobilis TaxID=1849582 RepID=A0ABS2KDQ8_9GAMM|nr:hypothetical protein [Dyella mobilis]MBM7129224.1 hypothetical protein [Dyella mobilis]GLQ98519.1 hypothetical protein GCM10007863_29390 [Dyella mobilis]
MYLLDHPAVLFAVTCIVLLLAHEFGYRLRALAAHRDDRDWQKEVRETRGQIAVLLSLLLGFAMAMGLSRFDERKKLVADEANAIATAYQRAAMQAEPVRSRAPSLLHDYLKARIAIFSLARGNGEQQSAMEQSRAIQQALWSDAVAVAQQNQTPIVALYAQSLNMLFDVDGERVEATLNRIPVDIWLLLGFLAALTSLVVGYGQRHRSWFATFIPVLMVAISISLIADLDTPASGFIQINQHSLQSLRAELQLLPGDAQAH